MYNDSVAIKILKKVEDLRNNKDCLSKSKWEKELVDEVYNEINLLDLESYTNLNHLYDYRNFSARYMEKTYSNLGKESELYDFFIFYYGDSQSFDTADERFELVIAPYLSSFISSQLRDLIECCNGNSQIYRRWAAYSSNTKIAKAISQKLGKDFDFSEYENFDFDKSILEEKD